MWDQTRDGAPIWRLDHRLVDPWIAVSFVLRVVLIVMVEARGGSQAQRFRQAVRLAPIAFAVPAVAVAISDPILPTWLA